MADHNETNERNLQCGTFDVDRKSTMVNNGQRIYGGPPEGWKGAQPSRGCEVYVTRIPRDCFESELLPVFTKVGPIYEHRLMMEQNGLNRGYAYVKFTNVQVRSEVVT